MEIKVSFYFCNTDIPILILRHTYFYTNSLALLNTSHLNLKCLQLDDGCKEKMSFHFFNGKKNGFSSFYESVQHLRQYSVQSRA